MLKLIFSAHSRGSPIGGTPRDKPEPFVWSSGKVQHIVWLIRLHCLPCLLGCCISFVCLLACCWLVLLRLFVWLLCVIALRVCALVCSLACVYISNLIHLKRLRARFCSIAIHLKEIMYFRILFHLKKLYACFFCIAITLKIWFFLYNRFLAMI